MAILFIVLIVLLVKTLSFTKRLNKTLSKTNNITENLNEMSIKGEYISSVSKKINHKRNLNFIKGIITLKTLINK